MAKISSINGNPIVPSNGSVGTAQVASGYNLMTDDEKSKLDGIDATTADRAEAAAERAEAAAKVAEGAGGGASVDLTGYLYTKAEVDERLTGYLKSADAEATYAPKSHKHAMADVTGLQAALDAAQDAATEEEYDRQVLAGTYQGRSLMTILGASSWADCYAMLSARAKLMDSSGIRVGDYIDVTPTSGTVNRGNAMRYRVAGMGHNYQFGDTACPWAFWMVPDDPIDMTGNTYAINTSYIYWNTTNNNNGVSGNEYPYLASNLRAWETGQFLPALPTALQNVLVNHRILLEKRYSSSGALTDSTGWNWVDAGKVFSLNEMEVYGCPVWGTKGWSVGEAAQLPLFRDSRYRKGSAIWWLRSVGSGSSSNVCYVHSSGTADSYSAKYNEVRPRPCFLIG